VPFERRNPSARLLALSVALLTGSVRAETTAEPPGRKGVGISLSFLGENLTHPGVVAGVEYRLLAPRPGHELLVRAFLGAYLHPSLYWALLAGGELSYRLTAGFGLCAELTGGLGYLHTTVASPVYELGSDGQVAAVTDWGRPAFMPSASLGIGWDFRDVGLPLRFMLRPQVFWQYPYNTHALTHVALLVGVTYSL
jgi:hypothetical protein